MDRDALKAAAAIAAVGEVESGMVVGLGTGSTAAHAVREIGALLSARRLTDIVGVPTSQATAELANDVGVPLITPGQAVIDLAIDGADEIDPHLALIKGGGGALLREKVIAVSARRFAVISDDSKMVPALGSSFDLPLEVVQFGLAITIDALVEFGGPELRLDDSDAPFVTDNGNYIIDLSVLPITDPTATNIALHNVPGVLATGLFVGIADVAYIAGAGGIRRIEAGSPA